LLWTIEVHLLYLKQLINSKFETYTEKGNAFDISSIAALPASPWHPDCFGNWHCHQNRYKSPLSVLRIGYDVGVRESENDNLVLVFVLIILYSLELEYDRL
jgi:hypothetical protein